MFRPLQQQALCMCLDRACVHCQTPHLHTVDHILVSQQHLHQLPRLCVIDVHPSIITPTRHQPVPSPNKHTLLDIGLEVDLTDVALLQPSPSLACTPGPTCTAVAVHTDVDVTAAIGSAAATAAAVVSRQSGWRRWVAVPV